MARPESTLNWNIVKLNIHILKVNIQSNVHSMLCIIYDQFSDV